MEDTTLEAHLRRAQALARACRTEEAASLFSHTHEARPDSVEAAFGVSRLAIQRGDTALGQSALLAASAFNPQHEGLAVELAVAWASAGRLGDAIGSLRGFVERVPASPLAWLLLGQMLEDSGDTLASLLARFEAIGNAQRLGVWREPASTPPHLVALVGRAVDNIRRHRRDIFFAVIEPLRSVHGNAALQRVDRALTGYLREWDAVPSDAMQRPRFFYFPGLPTQPFLDPRLQPWAKRLQAAFGDIRQEALSTVLNLEGLENFVKIRDGENIGDYLGGVRPAWEAFFFYRHGERFDANHERCPRTSSVLESLGLVRIPGQTPEICFSVLAPGTHILPHFGVTNTRTVMHLPLLVPEHCALNLVGHGEHQWKEGELVLFDDTFLHEAWNRSDTVRIVLLMDCWNPHLTPVEREATVRIAQAIGVLDIALGDYPWPTT